MNEHRTSYVLHSPATLNDVRVWLTSAEELGYSPDSRVEIGYKSIMVSTAIREDAK